MSTPSTRTGHPLRRLRSGPAAGFDRGLLITMMLGSILNPVNSSIIAVSLIPIGRAFGAPPSRTAWLVSALYLATAVGQPVVGRLVDLHGPRRLFLTGALLTGVAGVIGTAAPNLPTLVAARVVLGFGTCAGYPAAMYLIRSEARRTGRESPTGVLTALAVTTQTIAVIGPALGGLLIAVGGWRSTFAVNIPLAIACVAIGGRQLPREPSGGSNAATPARLDYAGITLFAGTLLSVLLFLMMPRLDLAWLLLVSVVTGTAFAIRELRAEDPFIDVRVLSGNLPLLFTYARTLLAQLVAYAVLYGFTQWLEDGRGLSASAAGLLLLPMFGTAILVSTLTGRRPQLRGKLVVGAATQLGVCLVLLTVGTHTSIWLLLAVVVVFGVPQGLNSLANQNAVYWQADGDRIGASSGLLRTFGYLGAIGASAATGAFLSPTAGTAGMHELSLFMLVVAGLFLALTVVDRSLSAIGR